MPIEIVIKNTEIEGTAPNNPIVPNENQDEEKKVAGKKDIAKAQMINFLKSQAKTWALTGIQSYTKYTGQGLLQNKISTALTMVDDAMGIAVGFAIGGVVGGAIAIGSLVSKYAMEIHNQNMEIKTQNRTISINNIGLGNRNMNGGRYGA